MEADWEVEMGGDAPVIDGHWGGYVDLRRWPERASELAEAVAVPALTEALVRLNGCDSPVWTSKCDVWKDQAFDADELDAPGDSALRAIACYVDLLPDGDGDWPTIELALTWCRAICGRVRSQAARCCRADLVIRRAWLTPDSERFGVTTYITACGATDADALGSLTSALEVIVEAVVRSSTPAGSDSKLQ
jgi:hypothetical protein